MSVPIQPVRPRYGDGGNYDIGHIGFTFGASAIGDGIEWLTRWDNLKDVPVSHALIVTGENECVEAIMGSGVQKNSLSKYFDDANSRLYFRRPRSYTRATGQAIAAAAASQIGVRYDGLLISFFALRGSFLGHAINKLIGPSGDGTVADLLHTQHAWICSELAAYCLDQQPAYHGQGVLTRHLDQIDPETLFSDDALFDPWASLNFSSHAPAGP